MWQSESGISLVEIMVSLGILSVVMLGQTEMMQQMTRGIKSNQVSSGRDDLVNRISRHVRDSVTLSASATNSLNFTQNRMFNDCVNAATSCGAATCCIAGGSNDLYLYNQAGTGIVSGIVSAPQRYDTDGVQCTAVSNKCALEVYTSFQASCGVGVASCLQAKSVTVSFTIQQAAGAKLPTPLVAKTGNFITQVPLVITAQGTVNYIAKWIDSNGTIGNSTMIEEISNGGIRTDTNFSIGSATATQAAAVAPYDTGGTTTLPKLNLNANTFLMKGMSATSSTTLYMDGAVDAIALAAPPTGTLSTASVALQFFRKTVYKWGLGLLDDDSFGLYNNATSSYGLFIHPTTNSLTIGGKTPNFATYTSLGILNTSAKLSVLGNSILLQGNSTADIATGFIIDEDSVVGATVAGITTKSAGIEFFRQKAYQFGSYLTEDNGYAIYNGTSGFTGGANTGLRTAFYVSPANNTISLGGSTSFFGTQFGGMAAASVPAGSVETLGNLFVNKIFSVSGGDVGSYCGTSGTLRQWMGTCLANTSCSSGIAGNFLFLSGVSNSNYGDQGGGGGGGCGNATANRVIGLSEHVMVPKGSLSIGVPPQTFMSQDNGANTYFTKWTGYANNHLYIHGQLSVNGAGNGRAAYINGDIELNGDIICAKNGGNCNIVGGGGNNGNGNGNSDIRLKKDVQPLQNSLESLLQLKGVSFRWKDPKRQQSDSKTQIGLIAQEVEEIFPQWVGRDRDGYKTLNLRGFEALTVESLRELKAENDLLRAELETLKNEMRQLRDLEFHKHQ